MTALQTLEAATDAPSAETGRAPARVAPSARPGHLPVLDVARFGAAAYVAAYHCVDLLTASGHRFHEPGGAFRMLLHGNLLGLFGYGHFAVMLFFVLSGVSVHLRQAMKPETVSKTNFNPWLRTYAFKRFMRLYPAMLVAMGLTALLGLLGFHFFPEFYGHRLDHPVGSPLMMHIGSLPELGSVISPVNGEESFGANGVLWSLTYERWFYVAYPLVLLVLRIKSLTVGRTFVGWTVVSVVVFSLGLEQHLPYPLADQTQIAMYFSLWLGGAYLADLYARGAVINRPALVFGLASALILSACSQTVGSADFLLDGTVALGFGLALAAVILKDRQVETSRMVEFFADQSRWSYSLYLAHMPVILFVFGSLGHGTQLVTNPFVVVAAFASTVVAALALYAVVERPSAALVRRVRF